MYPSSSAVSSYIIRCLSSKDLRFCYSLKPTFCDRTMRCSFSASFILFVYVPLFAKCALSSVLIFFPKPATSNSPRVQWRRPSSSYSPPWWFKYEYRVRFATLSMLKSSPFFRCSMSSDMCSAIFGVCVHRNLFVAAIPNPSIEKIKFRPNTPFAAVFPVES